MLQLHPQECQVPDRVEQVIRDGDYTRKLREPWNSRFQEICDYFLPEQADYTVHRGPGQLRAEKIYNSIGVWCLNEAAARIDSFLTGSGTAWLGLVVDGDPLAKDPEVIGWLQQCLKIFFRVTQDPASGFDIAKAQTYKQILGPGTGPMFVGETESGLPYYRAAFLGQVSYWIDDFGVVQGVFRHYKNSAWSLRRQFGEDKLPEPIRRALADESHREFEMLHATIPWDEDRDGFNLAGQEYVEYYIAMEGKALLRRKGYYEMPWLMPGWEWSPGEGYARSPSWWALADVRELQLVRRSAAKVVHKNADPGWMAEDSGSTQPRLNSSPGGVSYGRMNAQGHFSIQQLQPYGNPETIAKYEGYLEERVKKHFFLDAFKLFDKMQPDGQQVYASAAEVAIRQSEQLRLAGPLLVGLRTKELYPLVHRSMRILGRNGYLPMPPYKLLVARAKVYPEYRSPLALAQVSQDRQAVLQTIGDIMPLMQVDPTAMDIINIARTGAVLGRANNSPMEMFATPAELAQIRKARQDAAQAGQQSMDMKNRAQANLASAQATQALRSA
jgi:head-to-tail connecting protein